MRSFSGATLRRAAVAGAVAATLLAAGCSNAAPGVVAYVGDAEITQTQLETAVAAVSTTVEQGQTVSSEAVINAMIQGELAEQIAVEKKITITDAQRDTFLKTTNLAPLLNVPDAKPIAYDVADQQIVAQSLGAAPFLAEIEKRQVKLNPRFGVLDLKQKTILEGQSGSLSEPGEPAPVQTP
ncbi:MAG: hypothetical protein ABWX96_16955 [Propionibacteriaceae bacterium]